MSHYSSSWNEKISSNEDFNICCHWRHCLFGQTIKTIHDRCQLGTSPARKGYDLHWIGRAPWTVHSLPSNYYKVDRTYWNHCVDEPWVCTLISWQWETTCRPISRRMQDRSSLCASLVYICPSTIFSSVYLSKNVNLFIPMNSDILSTWSIRRRYQMYIMQGTTKTASESSALTIPRISWVIRSTFCCCNIFHRLYSGISSRSGAQTKSLTSSVNCTDDLIRLLW